MLMCQALKRANEVHVCHYSRTACSLDAGAQHAQDCRVPPSMFAAGPFETGDGPFITCPPSKAVDTIALHGGSNACTAGHQASRL
jgi:hypothetical protein